MIRTGRSKIVQDQRRKSRNRRWLLAAPRARTADHCQFFGEDRAKAYEIAIMTGCRANEIRSLAQRHGPAATAVK